MPRNQLIFQEIHKDSPLLSVASRTALVVAMAAAAPAPVLAVEPTEIDKYLQVVPSLPGSPAKALGPGAVAIGYDTLASARHIPIGQGAVSSSTADNSAGRGVSLGTGVISHGDGIALGGRAQAEDFSVAVGRSAQSDLRGTTIGNNSYAQSDAVAIGNGSRAVVEANTVSVGNADVKRRIVNVADGVGKADAVNMRQFGELSGFVVRLQDSALKFDGDSFSAFSGRRISHVADGTEALDAVNKRQLDGVESQARAAQQAANQVGTDLAAIDAQAVKYTDAGRRAVSFGDPPIGTVRLSNVADGVNGTDAVNKGQLDAVSGQIGSAVGNALQFDSSSASYNATRSGAATRISGVASGTASSDAVNKGQLDTVAGGLATLDSLAVKYTDGSYTAVLFGNPKSQAVRLSNVADGVDGTDAVNKRQLDTVASNVGQVNDKALLFDGQAYNAARSGQPTRISGVAAAMSGTDAVNFNQMGALSAAFGGGISWSNGALTSPTYNIAGGSFGNVGDALAALNGKLSSLETSVGEAVNGTVRAAGTLDGTNGTRISNVKAGVAGTDAANVGQVRQGIAESRSYTDTKAQETLRETNAYTDSKLSDIWQGLDERDARINGRFREQDKRIDRQSAMTSAMVQMAINTGGSRSENGRIGAGLGLSGGQRALSIGWSKAIGLASVSFGGAISGSESSAGIGFGIDL